MVARVVSVGILWALAGFVAVEATPSSFDYSVDQRVAIGNCTRCHQFSATRSHVTGVRPTFELPAAYPLSEKGELTCSTCHDVKTSSEQRAPAVRGGLQGATFCRSCHAVRAEEGSRLAHAVRQGSAHTARSLQTPNRVSRTRPASLDCEACHDGVMSEDGHWNAPPQIARSGRDLGHPVGVDYSGAQIHSTTLTPVPMLDPAISLE